MSTLLLISNIMVVIGAIVGMYLVSEKNKWGFVVFLLAEVSIAYIGVVTKNYGLLVVAGSYIFMNIYSYLKWRKQDLQQVHNG